MTDKKQESVAVPQDNAMPAPPAGDEAVTTLDNAMPSGPAKKEEAITTMDNAMPAPPALDLDGNGR
ncbi:hypothetical protein ACFYOV_20610 [Streptomyces sp. NPDC005931]|uniref:hypothetical protein n=1 Tax=Streptomyces sp. NPDC005931 TaxID=3364737 RepID=UPI003676E224